MTRHDHHPSGRSTGSAHERLIRKLQSTSQLSADEAEALRRLTLTIRTLPDDKDIVVDGERPSDCCLVVEGFLFRHKMNPSGARQIMSLHVAGDIPDLQSLHLKVMDHGLGGLSESKVAFIPHTAFHDLVRR